MRDIWRNAQVVASVDLGNGLSLVVKVAASENGEFAAIAKMGAGGSVISAVGFRLTADVRRLLRQLADADVKPKADRPKSAAAAADSGAAKALESRLERLEKLLQRLVDK